jgi:Fic-DOC domain mobile mystery protein B
MKLTNPEGATPLDAAALEALIPSLSTQRELNEFEAANVADAVLWALKSRRIRRDLLTLAVLKELHRQMFDRTWKWAGKFRTSDTNIGIPWSQISEAVRNLCDDVAYQAAHSAYPTDEMAVRFHHRMVTVHPFPNGNGRHARLAADLLMRRQGVEPFSWGAASLVQDGAARREYLAALKEADGGKFERLISFSRTSIGSDRGAS